MQNKTELSEREKLEIRQLSRELIIDLGKTITNFEHIVLSKHQNVCAGIILFNAALNILGSVVTSAVSRGAVESEILDDVNNGVKEILKMWREEIL